VESRIPVGVPEITQDVVLILKPTVSAGEMVQFVIAAPLLFKVVGVTDIIAPTVPEVPVAPI
jgi:hypothetical protein